MNPRAGRNAEKSNESLWFWTMHRWGKAANPFHSLAALQKLAHNDSFGTALAVAFP